MQSKLPLKVIHWCHWSGREISLDRNSFVELAFWHKVLTEKSIRRLPNSLSISLVQSLVGQIARSMSQVEVGSLDSLKKDCYVDRIWSEPWPKPSQCTALPAHPELSFSPSPQTNMNDDNQMSDCPLHPTNTFPRPTRARGITSRCYGATSLTAVDRTKTTSSFDKSQIVLILMIMFVILPSLSIITLSWRPMRQ